MLAAERQARVSRRDSWDAEVYAFLLWTQWLFGYALPLRHTVVLNLDETAVPYQLTGLYGNVVPVRARSAASSLLYERVSRRSTRGHLTVVSVISADATLQRYVPQFILPKDASLSNMEKGMLLELPSPIHYVSGTGGWVTSVIMKGLLTVLRRAVRSVRPEHHIVVALDAANQHIAADVLAHAARLQVHLLLIPARMTHLLQPLDSHVFGCFKRDLLEAHCAVRGQHPSGCLPAGAWIPILASAISRNFVERHWADAMASNGLTGDLSRVRQRVLAHIPGCLPLPLRPPSAAEMDSMAGRHRRTLCAAVLRRAQAIGDARSAAAAAAAAGEVLS